MGNEEIFVSIGWNKKTLSTPNLYTVLTAEKFLNLIVLP